MQGVLHGDPVLEESQLRIHHQLGRVLHLMSGHPHLLAGRFGLGRGTLRRPSAEHVFQLLAVGQPLGDGHRGQIVAVEQAGQANPGRFALGHHRHPPVLPGAGEHTVGAQLQVGVAVALPHPAVQLLIEHGRSQEMQGRFGLGEVDVLALAGAAAMIQRRQQRGQRHRW